MLINVTGTKSYKKQELTTNVLNFCEEKLFPDYRKSLSINVLFVKEILDTTKGAQGACSPTSKRVKEFNIEIRNNIRNIETIIYILCHEMVHVKQFINKELTYKDSGNFIYDNRVYSVLNSTNKEYMSWPWEKEARKLGKKLAKEYMKGGS